MNRINKLFQQKQSTILSVYFTAGSPTLNSTAEIIKTLAASGADMIEIGIPFSDPIADGPVIQKSSDKALKNGMSLKLLFDQIRDIRKEVSLPLLMMGYLNPVLQYGMEPFCRSCEAVGIDGVILPDMPVNHYLEHYQQAFLRSGLQPVFFISPETSEERIRFIDTVSSSFIYMVSASSTTGAQGAFSPKQLAYFRRIQDMQLKTPRLIGFGIATRETYQDACQYAQGAIIGTAFVKALEQEGDLKGNIRNFCQTFRG